MATSKRAPFAIDDHSVPAGRRQQFELPISRLMSGTPVGLPVIVLHGTREGPTVWLSAAVHGDEICGVEIIRRVLEHLQPRAMAGTVLAVPIVNVHGFNTGDRYLPDRRDLNRSFPGSERGPLASRIAHLMMTEIIAKSSVGIDLHTGSDARTNLPQVRGDLDDARTLELATTFGAPVAIHSRVRDGSLRQAATEAGAAVLLFEGGEASRFDPHAIAVGTEGVLRVLRSLGVIQPDATTSEPAAELAISRQTRWVRATSSGILHLDAELGSHVAVGESIATIYDPFGKRLSRITSRIAGLVIGATENPLVHRGDAIAHIAAIDEPHGEHASSV
jgi:predicted deacylase